MARSQLPPLAVRDALEVLARNADRELRPLDFERLLEIPQYLASRLIKRLVRDGFAVQVPHKNDRRSSCVKITKAGLEMSARMATPYSIALQKSIGAKLSTEEAQLLCALLDRIGTSQKGDPAFTRFRRAPRGAPRLGKQ